MKKILSLYFLGLFSIAYSQVISEEEFRIKVKTEQENCVGAHESIVLQINEGFAKSIWGKKVRFNDANIIKFFNYPSGEEVSAGVDVYMKDRKNWAYVFDQKAAADLLQENGVKVIHSFNTLWITARQNLLHAETTWEEQKIVLELYCPGQSCLEKLRTGKTQSIEFLVTGYWGSVTSNSKIYGVLTNVNAEKQIIKCSNGHEFDKVIGYKFCPVCGEPLE
jgi:hypothetical protein